MPKTVSIGDVEIGGKDLVVMAGPCAVESQDQLFRIAEKVKEAGADFLRGGGYKPRTRGGDWEGLKEQGLEILARAKERFGLRIVTEILDKAHIPLFQQYGVDLYQVGARNTQNQTLVNELGKVVVPVLLKNGMNTSMKEWLGAAKRVPAEYCILCMRGKNVDTDVARNSADLVTLAHLVQDVDYPIIFDPSHSTGRRDLVYRVSIAAVATGANGLLIETHHDPENAITDGQESILPGELAVLVKHALEERARYLDRISQYKRHMQRVQLPIYVTIYFREADLARIKELLGDINVKPYKENTGLLEAKIRDGHLGKLPRSGYAVGKLFNMARKGEDAAYGISLQEEGESKMLISPFSAEAVRARGGKTVLDRGQFAKRIEFSNAYPGDRVRDAFSTYQGRLIVYKTK